MSVIFGKYNINKNQFPNQQLVKMQNALNYWDADDMGLWKNEHVGLGHLMMWNTPESLHEKQPFTNPNTKNVITADARIDNREELFRQLNISNHKITDSELILKAYEKWDNDCVKYLYGVFAFAIWNPNKEELFCARDHMGIRPLFYYFENGEFIFSTAIQGLTSFEYVSNELKDNYEYILLCDAHNDDNQSVYKNIHLLLPSNYMIINRKGITLQEYWDFDASKSITYKKDSDYLEHFQELLKKAIQSRLRTAFPLGSHISGGLDSSAIIAYGLPFIKKNNLDFHTYGLVMSKKHHGVEWPFRDERAAIDIVKKHLNLDKVHLIDLEHSKSYLDYITQLEKLAGGPYPFPASIMTLNSTEYVKKQQVRTILSGVLGNYGVSWKANHYDELYEKFKWGKLLKNLYTDKGNPIKNIARFAKKTYLQKTATFNKDILKIIHPDYFNEAAPLIASKFRKRRFTEAYETKTAQVELLKIIRPRLFQDSLIAIKDKVELRYPLADIKLLEYFIALPNQQKYDKGINRLLFRKVVSQKLPDYIAWEFKATTPSLPQLDLHFKQNLPEIEQFLFTAYQNNHLKHVNYDYIKTVLDEIKKPKRVVLHRRIIYRAIMYAAYYSQNQK